MQTSLGTTYKRLLIPAAGEHGGDNLSFRLQTTEAPVYCSLQQGFRTDSEIVPPETFPVLEYQCHCSPGYFQDQHGECHFFWSLGRILGLALGCATIVVLVTLAITRVCLHSQRRRRRLAFDLDLHKELLEEATSDVLALKRAWEIDWRDLALTTRIDQGAEGAFGEVGFPLHLRRSRRTALT